MYFAFGVIHWQSQVRSSLWPVILHGVPVVILVLDIARREPSSRVSLLSLCPSPQAKTAIWLTICSCCATVAVMPRPAGCGGAVLLVSRKLRAAVRIVMPILRTLLYVGDKFQHETTLVCGVTTLLSTAAVIMWLERCSSASSTVSLLCTHLGTSFAGYVASWALCRLYCKREGTPGARGRLAKYLEHSGNYNELEDDQLQGTSQLYHIFADQSMAPDKLDDLCEKLSEHWNLPRASIVAWRGS